ncbi:MAG: 3-phosphoserine/phosphohydroxythreonine transaminase [Pseudomonadota bacterium]
MSRVFNFSAGPAVLPEPVLQRVQEDMMSWGTSGMSVMEMSHRGKEFVGIAEQAEADFRQLLGVPDDYTVLFLQGGATLQFAATVLNLAAPEDVVDYVVTGSWGKKAIKEAGRFATVNVAADAQSNGYTDIPEFGDWNVSKGAAYLHYTPNETIGGVEFHEIPDAVTDAPLVADMSSTILSRPLEVSRFGVIYAGAQKNIGPAGLTIVLVRNDLLESRRENVPTMLQYSAQASAGSMSNTPPTFAWYVAGLVFQWLIEEGGLDVMALRNQRKAETLYGAIDQSDFYASPVPPRSRSRMNVPFTLASADLDSKFLELSAERGLMTLKGHRSVGGMRASLYNAMPQEAVDSLVEFMADFEKRYG